MSNQTDVPKELRDYSSAKFGERYQEFRDEHMKKIIETLNFAYDKFKMYGEDKLNFTDCVGFVSFPLVALALGVGYRNGVLVGIAFMSTLVLAIYVIPHYREKGIKALYREYERKRILADYVRREEDYIISKLMWNDTIDSFYRESQYSNIKRFFEKVIKDLQESKFTDERY